MNKDIIIFFILAFFFLDALAYSFASFKYGAGRDIYLLIPGSGFYYLIKNLKQND